MGFCDREECAMEQEELKARVRELEAALKEALDTGKLDSDHDLFMRLNAIAYATSPETEAAQAQAKLQLERGIRSGKSDGVKR